MIEIILIGTAIVVGVILIYAASLPNHFLIQRSLSCKATPEQIFPFINDLHSMQTWSAWETVDPEMKRRYTGPASGVGAKYSWDGNKQIGQGSMEITKVQEPARVTFMLDFIKPFPGHCKVDFTLTTLGNHTIVTQTMYGKNSIIPKLMCALFFDQEKMIGSKFEESLAKLKTLVEV